MFNGFGPGAFAWFTELAADNTRDWFTAHRDTYDNAVRGPLTAVLEELAGDAPVWIARPNRDVRFSQDKSPYKTRCYGTIDGKLYAELSPDGLFAGTGAYGMDRGQLDRFRAAVDDPRSGGEIESIVGSLDAAGIETWGEALKTAPRGYDRDHPRAKLLRHKMLVAGSRLAPDPRAGIGREVALSHLTETWTACTPLLAWLDEHVGPPADAPRG
jgi:uncharacterized protein (TIGR02453 family)